MSEYSMNKVCMGCKNERYDQRYHKFECSNAYYELSEYGSFKRGCYCVYDKDLANKYVPKEGHQPSAIDMLNERIAELDMANMKLRDQISTLKDRLTRVE